MISSGRRVAWCLLLAAPAVALAQDAAPLADDAGQRRDVSVPFAFYNDLFGVAAGYSWAREGFLQPQANVVVSGMAGTAGTGMLYLRSRNLLVPGFDRLFADPLAIVGYFHGNYLYADGNPRFPSQHAGTNGSAYDDYVTGNGWNNLFRVAFRYLLPIGWGRDHVVDDYRLARGLLVGGATGGASLNPLTSGKTFLVARPFYASQTLSAAGATSSQKTNGVDLMLNWDNRDFFTNPSVGQSLTLRWSRDFGWLDSTSRWSVVSGEVDQYFSLGSTDAFRQQVLALDAWTADTPSWQELPDGRIVNRPPVYTGATLGGWWKMRGYRIARFSDRAGIYYAAEYRLIPRWNPFERMGWLQDRLGVQWIQLAPFFELGRVAPSWNLRELHSDMKWDAGLGLRFLARTILVRIDVGVSRESTAVQMMVEQPFQF